jgi:hypothetical protein
MSEDINARVEAVLCRELAGCQSVLDCEQLSAGASQETWRIRCNTNSVMPLLLPP